MFSDRARAIDLQSRIYLLCALVFCTEYYVGNVGYLEVYLRHITL